MTPYPAFSAVKTRTLLIMCARCAAMCRTESGQKLVRYVQPPKTSLWNLSKKSKCHLFNIFQGENLQTKFTIPFLKTSSSYISFPKALKKVYIITHISQLKTLARREEYFLLIII